MRNVTAGLQTKLIGRSNDPRWQVISQLICPGTMRLHCRVKTSTTAAHDDRKAHDRDQLSLLFPLPIHRHDRA
jgi:hypothetical protein